MTVFLNEEKIRQTVSVLVEKGRVFEVRVIRKRPKQVLSGYFKNADVLLKELKKIDLSGCNVYITLNAVKEECYAAEQHDKFLPGASATNDNDIDYFCWLMVDLDPKRKSGISATDEEREAAFKLATRIYNFLKSHGFEEPVRGKSGNGAHLLYRVALANNAENKTLLQSCLKALDLMFSNEAVEVDISTATPGHCTKAYGTLAQKGADTPERPHRMSSIVYVPDSVQVTDKAKLEWLASQLPQTEEATVSRTYAKQQGEFDIESWMQKFGIGYTAKPFRDGVKYVLDVCPFNDAHRSPDSSVFKYNNGKIGFRCFHNSCQGRTWRDVRMMFEPTAYDEPTRQDWKAQKQYRESNSQRQDWTPPILDIAHPAENEPVFLTAEQIYHRPEPEAQYVATGIPGIDSRIQGLVKGGVTILSGLRGGGKSTLLSQLALNMIENGQKVIVYSGELSAKIFMKWLYLQAAGKRHTKQSNKWANSYYVDSEETKQKINAWIGGKLLVFNNHYGNRFAKLAQIFRTKIEEVKADCLIIDNLMALDIDDRADLYRAQTNFIWAAKGIAQATNCAVIVVCHPRKAVGFLRLNDISGSGNLANTCDTAMIVHRKDNDFERALAEYFKGKSHGIPSDCTNAVEVCKDRLSGTVDAFVPLWYEPESKRLRPDTERTTHYGWETMFDGRQEPLLPEQDYFKGDVD